VAITIETIAFISALLGLAGALWNAYHKLYSAKEQIHTEQLRIVHRLEILEREIDAQKDRLTLGVNGCLEKVDHMKTRLVGTQNETQNRVSQMESYLQKNTAFEIRSWGGPGH
jgi:hypothetical protein